ncbi:MAG: DUF2752 domain-containing protein, partial [Polyangiaceae bacterium]|nr:DUF2752 domain-containing protein [Polyangiaceae bacterium]
AFFLVPGMPSICPMRVLLRIPCPGCGVVRASRLAATGHVHEAMQMHPLFWLAWIVLGALAVMQVVRWKRTRRWPTPLSRMESLLLWPALAIAFAVWIARFFGYFGGPVPI